MKITKVSRIDRQNRVSLGTGVIESLGLRQGDYVIITKMGDAQFVINKLGGMNNTFPGS